MVVHLVRGGCHQQRSCPQNQVICRLGSLLYHVLFNVSSCIPNWGRHWCAALHLLEIELGSLCPAQ